MYDGRGCDGPCWSLRACASQFGWFGSARSFVFCARAAVLSGAYSQARSWRRMPRTPLAPVLPAMKSRRSARTSRRDRARAVRRRRRGRSISDSPITPEGDLELLGVLDVAVPIGMPGGAVAGLPARSADRSGPGYTGRRHAAADRRGLQRSVSAAVDAAMRAELRGLRAPAPGRDPGLQTARGSRLREVPAAHATNRAEASAHERRSRPPHSRRPRARPAASAIPMSSTTPSSSRRRTVHTTHVDERIGIPWTSARVRRGQSRRGIGEPRHRRSRCDRRAAGRSHRAASHPHHACSTVRPVGS